MNKFLLVLAITAVAMAGCKEKPGAGESGAKLLQERCTRCHPFSIKHAHATKEEWEQTVTKMIGKGATLNTEEKEVLVDFLVKYYKPQ